MCKALACSSSTGMFTSFSTLTESRHAGQGDEEAQDESLHDDCIEGEERREGDRDGSGSRIEAEIYENGLRGIPPEKSGQIAQLPNNSRGAVQ